METTQDFLRNLWKWKCNVPERVEVKKETLSVDSLRLSEWDSEFEMYMRNRLVMGAFRYGRIRESAKPDYDRTASMIKRIGLYQITGNKEHLVDVANICMVEYMIGKGEHFTSIDDGEHVVVRKS